MKPFIMNFAALQIVPILVHKAKTAEEQIELIYDAADDPLTPRGPATALAALAGKMMNKLQNPG